MNSKFFWVVVVAVAGVLAGWYYLGGMQSKGLSPAAPRGEQTGTPAAMPGESDTSGGTAGTGKGGIGVQATVTYSDSGFTPASVTVKVGTTVSFVSEAGNGMWVASALHPTHQVLPGFDQLKSVSKGGTYEYTFTKVGTWKYHNHVAPGSTGVVVVTE